MQIGDVVQVKTGSAPMTVEAIKNDGSAACVWFPIVAYSDANPIYAARPERSTFDLPTLTLLSRVRSREEARNHAIRMSYRQLNQRQLAAFNAALGPKSERRKQ